MPTHVKQSKQAKYAERYSRQLILPDVGETGQQRLAKAKVLVVGAGGLGCPALQYLVAAGVGYIHLYDDDKIELSNLQRQTLYKISHLNRPKAEVAAQQLYGLNPDCQIHWQQKRVNEHSQIALNNIDAVLDCSDNFPTRFLLNKWCYQQQIPLIGASAEGTNGQLWVLDFKSQHHQGGCLRCLFPEKKSVSEKAPFSEKESFPQSDCNTLGVIGATLGALGSLQAGLCISLILGKTQPKRFIQLDGFGASTRQFSLTQSPGCELCG